MEDTLSIENICDGAVKEIFDREMQAILANLHDPNANDKSKRKLKLEFEFKPYEDRSGADVVFTCQSTLAGAAPMSSRFYLQRHGGKIIGVPHNPKQDHLFNRVSDTDLKKKEKELQ